MSNAKYKMIVEKIESTLDINKDDFIFLLVDKDKNGNSIGHMSRRVGNALILLQLCAEEMILIAEKLYIEFSENKNAQKELEKLIFELIEDIKKYHSS